MWLRRWRVRHLVASWVVYWLLLLVAKLWEPFWEWYRITRSGGHGSVTVNFSGSILEMALWIAGPPILLTVLWASSRPPRATQQPIA